jgi:hypothetical protein
LNSLPHSLDQETFDRPDPFLPEQYNAQQIVAYNPALNDCLFPDDTTGQSDANYLPFDDVGLPAYLESTNNVNSYIQPSSEAFITFGMSTGSSTLEVSAESTKSNGVETQLRCQFPDCSQVGEFSTESALRKHQGKHTRPFACVVSDCKHPRFGDKGGLDRHKREVHGSKTYCCPINTCKRNTKGFPRKYNLFEHQKRCHPSQSPNTAMVPSRRSQSYNNFDEGTEDVGARDEETSSPEMTVPEDMARSSSVKLKEKLQEKLKGLCSLRADIDRDIEAVKRSMELFDDSH